jgi:hypothetical protein
MSAVDASSMREPATIAYGGGRFGEPTGGLPISDLRHQLAEARARRAVDDLEGSVRVVQTAIHSLSTLRGFSNAEFVGHAALTTLAAALRAARTSLAKASSTPALDLKAIPDPADFHRWLQLGDPR